MSVAGQGARAWNFLEHGFCAPVVERRPPEWTEALVLVREHEPVMAARRRELEQELEADGLGEAEPLRQNWRSFRPLALGREEAWSDWLAYLIETGEPQFVREVFGLVDDPARERRVERETHLPDSRRPEDCAYRSDILVEWDDQGVHLEVKVGDRCLDKTWGEARVLEEHRPERTWRHYMLLLPTQLRAFGDRARHPRLTNAPKVEPITWKDVSRALRAELKRRTSTTSWLGLAHAFLGALDQVLLRRPVLESDGAVPRWWSPALDQGQAGPDSGGEDGE
jgi:hypothetical protein